jgi:hypothetical protein
LFLAFRAEIPQWMSAVPENAAAIA